MNTHDDLPGTLRGTLQRRAESAGWSDEGRPLSLDDVQGRARSIRRRRFAVSGLAAAAVLAVAVPVGLGATGPDDARSVEPAGPSELLLTTDRPVGAEQSLTTVAPGRITPPGGAPVRVEADYLEVVPLGTGWVGMRSDEFRTGVEVVDASGDVEGFYPTDQVGLAVSRDGTVVAWVGEDGRIMTLVDGEEPREMYRADSFVKVVAVVGSRTCAPGSAGGGCTVYFEDDPFMESYTVTSKGIVRDLPELLDVSSVAEDGRVAGSVDIGDTGSAPVTDDYGGCSAVIAPDDGRMLWTSCDYGNLDFSPSGRFVLGVPAFSDGLGSPSLAILDADTGEVVSEVTHDRDKPAFVAQAEWTDVDEVLMTVTQGESGRVMRLTPTGTFDAVQDGEFENTDFETTELRLETRP